VGSTGSVERSKLFELVGDVIEAATAAVPGTWPVRVSELKIPALVAEILIELIVMLLPLVLVTVNPPALEMLDPAATVMATEELTVTFTWARATPAVAPTQQAIRIINQ